MSDPLTSCPMPVSVLRRFKFELVETGVRKHVRRLVRLGAHPVWSCEGHKGRVQPKWLWYSGPRAQWSAENYVRWDRPVVICAGSMREMLWVYQDTPEACTAVPVHIRPGSSLAAMKHAAPKGSRGWFLVAYRKVGR